MAAVVMPVGLADAHRALADAPDAHVLAGGTDFMVEVNYDDRRPPAVIALRHVDELRGWHVDGETVVIGALTTWTDLEAPEFAAIHPSLAQAARTVGSPQIRNAGTIGGNLGTASPAGDGLPPLYALDAEVVLSSAAGRRVLPIEEFIVGPKRTAINPGELIESVRVPVVDGPQEYLKVGTRNAMVISAAGVAVVVDRRTESVRCALGAVGPTIIRASDAERLAAAAIDFAGDTLAVDEATLAEFGESAAAAARPIDDHRSSAEYRRHAIGVMARRALGRCVNRGGAT